MHVSTCTCNTYTIDIKNHHENCAYRLYMEMKAERDQLNADSKEMLELIDWLRTDVLGEFDGYEYAKERTDMVLNKHLHVAKESTDTAKQGTRGRYE